MMAAQTWSERFEEWADYDQDDWQSDIDKLLETDQAVLNVALYIAADIGLSPIVQPLMDLGAKPIQSINRVSEFPIIVTSDMSKPSNNDPSGCRVNTFTRDRGTAMHRAIKRNDSAIAQLLFDNGFDVNMGAEGLERPEYVPLIAAI